jgi:hypothetical protein
LNVSELYEIKFPMFTASGNLVFLTKRTEIYKRDWQNFKVIQFQKKHLVISMYQGFMPTYWRSIPKNYSLATYGTVYVSTYLYQQLFSLRIPNNNSERCRWMDAHLLSILKVTSTQNLKHGINELSQNTPCQASGKSDQKWDISVIAHWII